METIKISEEEATIRRLMDSVFMKAAEAERLRQENEKLSADSVALGKIIKLIDEFKSTKTKTHTQVALYTLIWEISDIIDERGDLNVTPREWVLPA
jgi:hypothetical protein